ncbi:ACR3 family arsenite efflux transporter [Corynebacterium sp. CCM 8835]|uniref:ACR3 family arsenite efflux transporter n=1 Tax=Corynebacterium antarcticum TaxID=2800405 RepID=A0ABS1FKP2_9CORY|nr:ACR3 family arsenite efflux transporter [Corynebacterium antarcticum]MCL0244745.1 ACR3 family arsenite efflux transporter [Corynebacterium antarcticum]
MSTSPSAPVPARLSFLDRWLPVWIIAAMVLGILLGRFIPSLGRLLDSWSVGGISVPIALGLLVMMYPPLAKVRYDKTGEIAADRRLMTMTIALNWILGPALMFALAWLLLPDLPEYRTGLVIIGLARCIAMVLIWNDLACGDRETAAVLVAINSVFQVVMFSVLGWFYLQVLPSWLGLETTSAEFSFTAILVSVLVFLGIPLLAGFLSRVLGERIRSRRWYETRFLPRISPLALGGLLYTIVVLFSLQGGQLTANPWAVTRIAVPLVLYFFIMFILATVVSRTAGFGYATSTTIAFTAAGNNFELAIAVSIGTFGAMSGQALAGTIGPLIEVPVLLALVYVAMWWAPRLFPGDPTSPPGTAVRTRVR